MSSLYVSATFPQQRILRIIAGAVKNVADAHGEEFNPRRARSIAKRATGTLSSQWPEVLAASAPSGRSIRTASESNGRLAGAQAAKHARKGDVLRAKAFPTRLFIRDISRQLRDLKASGQTERAQAFIDVLRLVSNLSEPTPTERTEA